MRVTIRGTQPPSAPLACLHTTCLLMLCLPSPVSLVSLPPSVPAPQLLPLSLEMAKRKLTGIMNFTNPGAISHNEILQVRRVALVPVRVWCWGGLGAGGWGLQVHCGCWVPLCGKAGWGPVPAPASRCGSGHQLCCF